MIGFLLKRKWEKAWSRAVHAKTIQETRLAWAYEVKKPIKCNKFSGAAIFEDSYDLTKYQTTLNSCTCADFIERKLPCKHIYRLAQELRIINHIPPEGLEESGFEDKMIARRENEDAFAHNMNGPYLEFILSIVKDSLPVGAELTASSRSNYVSVHMKDKPRKVLCRLYFLVDGIFIEVTGHDRFKFASGPQDTTPKVNKHVHEWLVEVAQDF